MNRMGQFRTWLRGKSRTVRWTITSLLVSAFLLSPFVLYAGLAILLGTIPVNRDFVQADSGVEIFVWSNGVHTDFVVPAENGVMNWRGWFPADDLANPPATLSHIGFGWGDKGFFLNVPEWKDLTAKVALDALVLNGETAMHVTLLDSAPTPNLKCRRLRLSKEQYELLAGHLKNSFRPGESGKPVRIAATAYGSQDAFYEGAGHYGPVHTCNEWTGGGLRKAGVRMGVWTPFEPMVMRHLPE